MNFEPILYGPLFTRDARDINLVAASADPVDVTVTVGGSSWTVPVTPVLTGGRYLAPLRMQEILASVALPLGLQDPGAVDVPVITLSAGDASMSFRAIRGAAAGKTPAQLAGHWLSWRGQISKTYTWGRERLTFLAGLDLLGWRSGAYSVSVKIFLEGRDPVTRTLATGALQAGCQFITVDVSYATIAALVSGTVLAWDVSYSFSGTDSGGAAASIDGYPLRLAVARADVRVKEFVFCNGFGVEDRVYSSGRSNPKLEGSSVVFLNGGKESELRNDAEESREVYSGYLASARESALWLDFLKAYDRRILLSGLLEKIVVDSQETDLQDNALGSVKFTYHLAKLDAGRFFQDAEGLGDYDPAQQYGALYIGDDPASEDLPVEDLFFLKTRLDEFPAADLTEELLFLVQNPLTRAWGNAPLSGIKDWLQNAIHAERTPVWSGSWEDYTASVADYALAAAMGKDLDDRLRRVEGSGHTHTNLDVLDLISAESLEHWNKAYDWGNHAEAGYIKGYGYIGTTAVRPLSAAQALTGILSFRATDAAVSLVEWDDQAGAWHFHGHIFADGDVSGFYDGGTPGGGGSSDFNESRMWTALGTDISAKIIDVSHIPSITTAKISNLESWIAAKGYVTNSGVTSVSMTVPAGFSVSGSPVTSSGTLALSFASGYSLPTTAKQGSWDTAVSNVDAARRLLARAIASDQARIDAIEAALEEPFFQMLHARQMAAQIGAFDELRLGNLRLWFENVGTEAAPVYALRTDGHLLAAGDVSGHYTGGIPGSGGGSSEFDESSMWKALGTTINAKSISASYLPNTTVRLTGNVTGSGSGAALISINTTIGAGVVTDAMLAGSIAIAKVSGLQSALDGHTQDVGRLARAIGQNDARITSLEDWLNEPTFQAVSAGTVSAYTGAFNALDLSGVALSYTDSGVLQAAGSPLFSALSSSGATVSATIGGQARSITLASITLNGVATALGGSFRTATITAGTAGQSSATSGVSFSIPYLTMNAYGVVTGYGTHTHSISAAQIVAGLGTTPVNRAAADASGNTITTTYETIANVTAAQQRLARAVGSAFARLDTLEDACKNGLFSTLRATTVSADNFFTRSHAWIGGNVNAYGDVGGFYGSDARLKDRVRLFSDAADILRRVQPVRFVWRPEAARFNPANTGEDFGVIAQDARDACPLLVRKGQYGESDLLGVDYGRHLPALLLGGWHDHESRIAALERKIVELKQYRGNNEQ